MKGKQLIKSVVCVFLLALLGCYYLFYYFGTCGFYMGQQLNGRVTAEEIPEEVRDSYSQLGYEFVFQNRAGNPVYVRYDKQYKIVELKVFDKRFISNIYFAFQQITPGMELDEIMQIVGLPFLPTTNPAQAWFEGTNGKQYKINLQSEDGKYSNYKFVVVRDAENESYREVNAFPIKPYLRIAVVTIAGILLCIWLVKKKGILFKKKQVREQGDSSV